MPSSGSPGPTPWLGGRGATNKDPPPGRGGALGSPRHGDTDPATSPGTRCVTLGVTARPCSALTPLTAMTRCHQPPRGQGQGHSVTPTAPGCPQVTQHLPTCDMGCPSPPRTAHSDPKRAFPTTPHPRQGHQGLALTRWLRHRDLECPSHSFHLESSPSREGPCHPTASPCSPWCDLVFLSPPGVTQISSTAPTSTKPFGSCWQKWPQMDSPAPPSASHSQGCSSVTPCDLSRSPGPPQVTPGPSSTNTSTGPCLCPLLPGLSCHTPHHVAPQKHQNHCGTSKTPNPGCSPWHRPLKKQLWSRRTSEKLNSTRENPPCPCQLPPPCPRDHFNPAPLPAPGAEALPGVPPAPKDVELYL